MMKKLYGFLMTAILVLSVMPMAFAVTGEISQDFGGGIVEITVNPLEFGGIFGGQSLPKPTIFEVDPDTAIVDHQLYVSEIAVEVTPIEGLSEDDVLFSEDDEAGFVVAGSFDATHLLLIEDPTLWVKLSGVEVVPGTPISGTITYTISTGFLP